MNRKNTRERWKDPVFQKEIAPLISILVKGRVVLSDADMAGIAIGEAGPFKELWGINLYQAKLESSNMSYAALACLSGKKGTDLFST